MRAEALTPRAKAISCSLAWQLSRWRMARLVASVSIPRMRMHPLRTALTLSGVALGVAILLAVGIVSNSVLRAIHATIDDLAGKAELQITGGNSGFDESLLERVRAVPGVAHATGVLQQIVRVEDAQAHSERLLVLGVDFLDGDDAYFRDYHSRELEALRHDPLPFLNSTTHILLSREFAERFGYHLHDSVQLLRADGVEAFEICGFIDSPTLARAFGGAVAVMYVPAMQIAFGRGTNLDRIDIAVKPDQSVDAVAERLRAALGAAFVIGRPKLRGDQMGKMLGSVQMALTLAGAIALIAGMFLIYNTMSTSVAQRKRELSLLRALGATRRDVLWMITLEGALLGALGALAGTGLAIALARALLRVTSHSVDQVYLQLSVSELELQPWLFVLGAALGVAGATLASAIPAYRAATTIRPAQSAHETSSPRPIGFAPQLTLADGSALALFGASLGLLRITPIRGVPVGAAAAASALLVGGALAMPRLVQLLDRGLRGAWLRVEVELARDNLSRNIGRTTTTTASLMAGVALTMGFATFMESFVSSLQTWTSQVAPGDLFVTSGARVSGLSAKNTPMTPDLGPQLAAIQGVRAVRSLRLAEVDYLGLPIKLFSTELDLPAAQIRLRPVQGDERELERRLSAEPVVAISENLARRAGLSRGDVIELATAAGTRRFSIAGVLVDYTSDFGSVTMDRKTYARAWSDDRVDTFELRVQRGADVERVREAINERFGRARDLFVLTNREFREEFTKAVDQIYQILRMLELATLIVAVFGIINTLLAGVLDRVRELGVLRAIGMLRRQVLMMIVSEATLISLIGTLAGLSIGLAIGTIMIKHIMLAQLGWLFPFEMPVRSMVELCLTIVPLCALAGWYPARRAAALVVRDALSHEE
jgi:putative ABC transport system permease protein